MPCKGTTPLSSAEANSLIQNLPDWRLNGNVVEKEFRFKDYLAGLEFAYSIGELAESNDHHPDMLIGWRRVKLSFTTHVIRGLSMNDFIMAAKSELEFAKRSSP